MIRPELRAALQRHRETLAAAGVAALGLWIATRGGWLLGPLGLGLCALALVWAGTALRRTRFARAVTDPGLVEVDEGRIGYFGAGSTVLGGYIALADLAEIRLLTLRGAQHWRLKTGDGQALLIPVAAAGAPALYDAFAALPGIDMGRLAAALDRREVAQSLWHRPARASLDLAR
ncbi:hypothetical protein EOW65_04220 [Sinirhodobacter ferrireducens]|uniref:Uncharacterized protein n=1 Tax=Paenirhodobacter ferrireducens TaxID=1215032 RepID=A0A443LQH6_9RHOB|nr:hypothetical protein [Sinirhodobacter ferrireducens]RWR51377.1 hypothetical protein EOW65_04220 [Sinirhodobacter ferrireducens]